MNALRGPIGDEMNLSKAIALHLALAAACWAGELSGTVQGGRLHLEGALAPALQALLVTELVAGEPQRQGPNVPEAETDDYTWRRDRFQNLPQIRTFQLKLNGNNVVIPQSAFADLYDIKQAKVWSGKAGIFLRVAGGDASASYEATFKIVPSRMKKHLYQVVERTLRQGEFPTEVWERTTYHNTRWDSNI